MQFSQPGPRQNLHIGLHCPFSTWHKVHSGTKHLPKNSISNKNKEYQNCCYNQRSSSIEITLTDFGLLSRPHKSCIGTPSALKCVLFMIQLSYFQLKIRSISVRINFYQPGFAQKLILKYLFVIKIVSWFSCSEGRRTCMSEADSLL